MAKERGWWSIDLTVDVDECDLDHIADSIRKGFTSGEICANDTGDEGADDE